MKNLMKAAFIAIALATTCGTVYAQKTTARQRPDTEQRKPLTPEQRAEQRAKQVEKQAKRMAGQLAMDDATTEKFVATYKMYQDELYALRTEKNRPAVCPAPGKRPCAQAGTCPVKQELTEAKAEKILKARFDRQKKMQDLRLKYYKEYSKFLSQKQILRVYEMNCHHIGRKGDMRQRHHPKGQCPMKHRS